MRSPRLFAAWLCLLSACGTAPRNHSAAFFAGRLDESEAAIREEAAADPDAVDVLTLDRASLLLARGEPRRAETLLRVVRDRWDYLEQDSAAESAASVVTDDRARAYAGEPFERLAVRSMLTVANLLDDGGDAYAYQLQAAAKQRELADAEFGASAAPLFLSAVVRRDMPLHAGGARRAWSEFAAAAEPTFGLFTEASPVELASAVDGPPQAPGRVCVLVFDGRGPRKVSRSVRPDSGASVIVQGVAIEADLSVEIPAMTASPNQRLPLTAEAAGQVAPAVTVADFTQIAVRESDQLRDDRIQRATARAAAKTATAGAAAIAADANDAPALAIAAAVALMASRSAEECDLRQWSHLPDRLRAVWLEVPAGRQTVIVGRGDVAVPVPLRVRSGRTSYAGLWWSDAGVLGVPTVDRQSRVAAP